MYLVKAVERKSNKIINTTQTETFRDLAKQQKTDWQQFSKTYFLKLFKNNNFAFLLNVKTCCFPLLYIIIVLELMV